MNHKHKFSQKKHKMTVTQDFVEVLDFRKNFALNRSGKQDARQY